MKQRQDKTRLWRNCYHTVHICRCMMVSTGKLSTAKGHFHQLVGLAFWVWALWCNHHTLDTSEFLLFRRCGLFSKTGRTQRRTEYCLGFAHTSTQLLFQGCNHHQQLETSDFWQCSNPCVVMTSATLSTCVNPLIFMLITCHDGVLMTDRCECETATFPGLVSCFVQTHKQEGRPCPRGQDCLFSHSAYFVCSSFCCTDQL